MNEGVVLTEDQRDCLQEIVNVAIGQSCDSLARHLKVFVHLSVPRIRVVSKQSLSVELASFVGCVGAKVSGVSQSFFQVNVAPDISGQTFIIFNDFSLRELAGLLEYEGELTNAVEKKLLMDVANLLIETCVSRIGQQINTGLSYSDPTVLGQHILIDDLFDQKKLSWEDALLVEISYTLENSPFNCSMFLLMPCESIVVLKGKLDVLLEGL